MILPLQIVSNTCNFSHHQSRAATSNFLIHTHKCYELYYFVSGNLVFLYDGTEYTLSPHTLLLIAPSVLHGIHVQSELPYERYTFHFVPAFFAKERQEKIVSILPSLESVRSGTATLPFMFENADRLHIQSDLDDILALSGRDEASQHFLCPVLLESLLIRLYIAVSDASRPLPSFPQHDPPGLGGVLDYIRRHPSDKITLDSLSEQFFLSRSQLNNLFRKYFHTSVMNYVTTQRLSYAQKLLISGMSASEVALTVGYTDYSTFYRSYTKHIGHPPVTDKGTGPREHDVGWTSEISFADRFASFPASDTLSATELPDISFSNNAYDPLE